MKKILAAMVTIGAIAITPVTALAAPEQMPDGNIFDAEYYAQSNPDVVAVLGTDPAKLYQHYLVAGKAEGRRPYAEAVPVVSFEQSLIQKKLAVFKATFYDGIPYEDLVLSTYWGDTVIKSLADGYMYWGDEAEYKSLRTDESYFFNYERYAMDYPEVAAAVGNTKQALWNHYKNVGVYQGYVAYSYTGHGNAKLTCINVLPGLIAGAKSQRDQVKAVHNWLIAHIDYDMENYRNGTIAEYSYHLEGAINNGVTVCQGYSESFDYFMYLLGMDCEIVSNDYHAWNRVVVDGQLLAIDVTWDDDNYKKGWSKPYYTYFLISEEKMSRIRDHYAYEYDPFFR